MAFWITSEVKLFENRTNIDREVFENTDEDEQEVTVGIFDVATTISTLDAEIITDGTESESHHATYVCRLLVGCDQNLRKIFIQNFFVLFLLFPKIV